jgi:hypothetical protein
MSASTQTQAYSAAQGEVRSANASEAPGWFGGEGSGVVRAATNSFLGEVTHQLEQLAAALTRFRE